MVRIVSLTLAVMLLLCCSASGIAVRTSSSEVNMNDIGTVENNKEVVADTTDDTASDTYTDEPSEDTLTESETDDVSEETLGSVTETMVPDEILPDETESTETVVDETESTELPDADEAVTEETEEIKPVLPMLAPSENIDPSKPMVALTFDDGPGTHTERLLDILKANGAKATFFVVGSTLEYHRDTLIRITGEGHDIGGHSMTHRELTRVEKHEVISEIYGTRDKIHEITGVDTYLMRLPYGSFNDDVKAAGAEAGVAFINWSVDTLDWKLKNADAIYDMIMEKVSDGAVILCHDIHGTTVDAMEKVIPKLIEDGYQLVTFTELMAGTVERLEAGKVYNRR